MALRPRLLSDRAESLLSDLIHCVEDVGSHQKAYQVRSLLEGASFVAMNDGGTLDSDVLYLLVEAT